MAHTAYPYIWHTLRTLYQKNPHIVRNPDRTPANTVLRGAAIMGLRIYRAHLCRRLEDHSMAQDRR